MSVTVLVLPQPGHMEDDEWNAGHARSCNRGSREISSRSKSHAPYQPGPGEESPEWSLVAQNNQAGALEEIDLSDD